MRVVWGGVWRAFLLLGGVGWVELFGMMDMLGCLTLDGKQWEEDTWYTVGLGDVCEEIIKG